MDLSDTEREFGVRIGLEAWPLANPPARVSVAATEPVPAASTIKLFILAALLDSHGLSGEIELRPGDQVGGSGVLNSLSAGRSWSVRDLATLMIIVSDNTATNVLIDLLGVEFINGWIQAR